MQFNKKEIAAILNVANAMAEIDGKVDTIEMDVIYSQMTRFGIEYDELFALTETAILNMAPHTAIDIIANMSSVQKQYVQAILVVIMASDGEIHEREMIMLRMLTMQCSLPPINANDIKNTLNTFKNR